MTHSIGEGAGPLTLTLMTIFPLLSAGFSLTVASGAIYFLAKNDIIKLNGQSQGILSVLVLGAVCAW